jgi:cytochrome c oxidase cbb3-type subunit 3
MKLFYKSSLMILLLLLFNGCIAVLTAQTGVSTAEADPVANPTPKLMFGWFWEAENLIYVLFFLTGTILALVMFVMILMTVVLMRKYVKDKYSYDILEGWIPRLSLRGYWDRLTGIKLAGGVDSDQSQDLAHEYDGIRELDNAAPPLFNYIFYGTIGFSVIYLIAFHIADAPLSGVEYEMEVAAAEKAKALYEKNAANSINERNVKLLTDAANLSAGKEIFVKSCAVCHGASGEGKIGPNLTDKYWLHGGSLSDVFRTIKKGAPNGMQAWQGLLSAKEIAQVASYIQSIQGTNPPNAKEKQGELYEPPKSDQKTVISSVSN